MAAKDYHRPSRDAAPGAVADQAPPPAPEPAQDLDSKRPAYRTRLGRIVGCVWTNHGEAGAFFSVSIYRIYKPEGSDTWLSASSFGRDDLPLVAKVADTLHSWIFATQQGGETPF